MLKMNGDAHLLAILRKNGEIKWEIKIVACQQALAVCSLLKRDYTALI